MVYGIEERINIDRWKTNNVILKIILSYAKIISKSNVIMCLNLIVKPNV